MKQFLYTDNLRGHGLSYLKKSEEFTDGFLSRVEPYCGYRLSSGGINAEGQRYNLSFAGNRPLLMNYCYLGKEVTSQRNGNFLTHGVVSEEQLNGYAVDYFSGTGFFRRTLTKNEAQSPDEPISLADISDTGKKTNERYYKEIVELLNQNVTFSCDLIQATLLALKNGGHIRLFNFDSTKEYGNALNIVRAIQYLFPIKIANLITFNTRATSYTPLSVVDLAALKSDERLARCKFGSVEVLQFYDDRRSSCGTEGCNYYFYYDSPYHSIHFNNLLPAISWLFNGQGNKTEITVSNITQFHNIVHSITDRYDLQKTTVEEIASVLVEKLSYPIENLLNPDMMGGLITDSASSRLKAEKKSKNIKRREDDESAPVMENGAERTRNKKIIFAAVFLLLAVILLACVLIMVFVKRDVKEPGEIVDPIDPTPPIIKPDPNAYFTIKFEDGSERRFRFDETVRLDVPASVIGYTFEGYSDADGKLFTDGNGNLLDSYSIEDYAQIAASESWKANLNRIIISYGDGKSSELSCYTDGEIMIPQALLNSIISAYSHMVVKGFELDYGTGGIICSLETDELVWKDGYRTLSTEFYEKWLESGETINLRPVAEYIKYTVDFYDYFTMAKLGSSEIAYDKEITVSSDYCNKYLLNKYYVYTKQNEKYLKVFNTTENPDKWTGDYGLVKGYDSVIDSGENISLYISGLARVRLGNEQFDMEYGDDVFAKSLQMVADDAESALKKVNLIYIGSGNENNSVKTNMDFWFGVDATSVITATPAYSATFRFGYNTGMSLLDNGGVPLERNVIYLHFSNGGYMYEGDAMSDIKSALNYECPYIGKGSTEYASLLENTWALANDEGYSVFENYLLKSQSAVHSLFNENGGFIGDTAVFEEEQNGYISVFAVYRPRTVNISFSETVENYSVATSYGGNIDWDEIKKSAVGVERWGTYVSDWERERLLLSGKSGTEEVTTAMLTSLSAEEDNGELSINFAIKRVLYSISVSLSYGSYSYNSGNTRLYYNSEFSWETDKIEAAFRIELYNAVAWNEGWSVNGKAISVTSKTQKIEDVFAGTGTLANNVITINAVKAAPSARSYNIEYSQTMKYGTSASGTVNGKNLSEVYSVSSDKTVKYGGELKLGVPEGFTLSEVNLVTIEYVYTFIGWYCENTKITDSDGVIMNFASLYALSENKLELKITAVFERRINL